VKHWLLILVITSAFSSYGQDLFNDVIPVIHSGGYTATYRIDNDETRNSWTINAEISPAVLQVYCSAQPVSFVFYTDVDSIAFHLKANESKEFYVLPPNGKFALTEIQAVPYSPISFDSAEKHPAYHFKYETNNNNAYLQELKNEYGLEKLVEGSKTQKEKALKILNWVRGQGQHDENHMQKRTDAISLLQAAKEGKNFGSKEYAIITAACLNALEMPARVLVLKKKEAATAAADSSYVLCEFFMKDYNKWVLLDPQFEVMPLRNGIPLNAVEFQNTIVNYYQDLEIQSLFTINKRTYVNSIFPFLYYFQAKLDNSVVKNTVSEKLQDEKSVLLVPKGEKVLSAFNKQSKGALFITNSLADFYTSPYFLVLK
jgi:hypothetical protein